jgi:hypothetical protein
MRLLRDFDLARYRAFKQRLAAAGIELVTRWEAAPYSGPPVFTHHAVAMKTGLFSVRPLVVGNDLEQLQSVRDYLLHNQYCRDWALVLRGLGTMVGAGHFILVERSRFQGGSRDVLRDIVVASGGDQQDVEYALNATEEKVLGYFPWNDAEAAEQLAALVDGGATTPVSREEMITALKEFRDTAVDRLRAGDPQAATLAGAWQKLLNFWRGEDRGRDR